jgi:hypothetical protein
VNLALACHDLHLASPCAREMLRSSSHSGDRSVALSASWSLHAKLTIAGFHVSKASTVEQERLHRGRPFRGHLTGAGARAPRAGEYGALRCIVERQASHQSTTGDVRHANEALKRTSADGLPCDWLASSTRILHLVAWRAVARRLALR